MTREDIEAWTRKIYEEARAADASHTDTIAERIAGAETWAWSRLTIRELRAMSAALFATAIESRG